MQHKPLSKHGKVVTWKMFRFIDPLWGMQSCDVFFIVSLNTLLTNCRVVGDLRRHIACVMSQIYREYWHISILLIDKHSLFIYIYTYIYIYTFLVPHLPHSTIFILNTFHGVIAYMKTSSNGNIFRVTGLLCGEFTGPRWIPRTKASDAELWSFLWSAPE